MNKGMPAGLVLASAFLTACGAGSSDDVPAGASSAFEGVWQAPAYGQVIDYRHGVASSYEYTADYCQLIQREVISEEQLTDDDWVLSGAGSRLRKIVTLGGVDIRGPAFVRVNELPSSCQHQLVARSGSEGYQRDPESDFKLFWQTFHEQYLSFELKGVDWRSQYDRFRPRVTAATTEAELFELLAAMVEPLKDGHVEIVSQDDDVDFSNHVTTIDLLTQEFVDANGEVDSDEEYDEYVDYLISQIELIHQIRLSYAVDASTLRAAANEEVIWYRAPDNVGVLIIDSMVGFGSDDEAEIDAENELRILDEAITYALTDLQDTDGLIVDVRNNLGGFDAASQIIVKHFLDNERHLYSKQARLGNVRTELEAYFLKPADRAVYLKDVVLLTSRNTASAAEVFTLMMRNLPNVSIIGEPTQGIFSDALEKVLPNGFSFSLSNEFYLSPQGEWFEHVGIPVDKMISYGTWEQRQSEEDLALEAAHSMLTR